MARAALLAAVALLCAVGALGTQARMPGYMIAELHYEGFPNGLTGGVRYLRDAMRQGFIGKSETRKEELFEETHIVGIRYTVPPCMAEEFEDEWLKLEKEVEREKNNDQFHLMKTKTDNLFYMACGQWRSHDDLMDHLSSDHFTTFAQFVDKNDIRWELQIMKDVSHDVEDRQKGMHKNVERGTKTKDMTHVMFMFIVPPGEDKGFVNQWTDTAFKTIEEDGNRIYRLRRVATDNTRFYVFGSWDSMRDYQKHFHSGHMSDLLSYVDDNDVVWFAVPLEKVGRGSMM